MKSTGLHRAPELSDYFEQVSKGFENLSELTESDIQIATSKKNLVFETDKVRLFKYQKLEGVKPADKHPVLVAYSLIGSYKMLDLQPDRSVIRNMLEEGLDVYIIDWGQSNRADRWLSFEDFILQYMNDCVEYICSAHHVESASLLGICEGGVFATCFASLYPEKVRSLALAVTPIDFHADENADLKPEQGHLNRLLRNFSRHELEEMIDAYGQLPGEMSGLAFLEMTLVKSLTKYQWDAVKSLSGERKQVLNFLRMEKWLVDRPNHPGEAAKQWLIDLYNENQLANGEFTLQGKKINLKKINMPVLNIFSRDDHIVPPPTSKALKKLVSKTCNYQELELPAGHIGAFVSSKANRAFSNAVSESIPKLSGQ